MSEKILRLRAVMEKTGLSRSAVYALIADGDFPRQVLLGKRSVGWIEAEVSDWLTRRIEAHRKLHAPKPNAPPANPQRPRRPA